MTGRTLSFAVLATLLCLGSIAVPPARATECISYGGTSHIRGHFEFGDDGLMGVAVTGTHAYGIGPYGGFGVIDLSNPDLPELCGSLDLPGFLWKVAALDSFAYVIDFQYERFHIVDVSDPTSPSLRGQLDGLRGFDVVISGSQAYVVGAAFHVVDVADPDHPQVIGTCPTGGYALAVSGSHAYVAGGEDGLLVIDLSDPEHPSQIGQLPPELHNADTAVAMIGSIACVFERAHWGSSFLRVIDVSNPGQPRLVQNLDLPVWDCYTMVASGSSVYIPSDLLLVVDVSDPKVPFIKETLLQDPSGDPWYEVWSVAVAPTVSGSRVYASGNVCINGLAYVGWLTILDMPGSPSPGYIGTLSLPCCPSRLTALGSFAYVADGTRGVYVIDATDPTHPSIAGTCDTPDRACDVSVAGKLAFVADDLSGLQVLDVSDPHAPWIVGSLGTSGNAVAVEVSGTLACLASATAGLQVIDISVPETPTLLGTADTPGSAYDVAVSGDYAYVADGAPGLQVIDIADPTHPQIVGTLDVHPQAYAFDIATTRGYVYLTTSWSGLYVIDVADPTDPRVVGWRAVLDWAFGLSVTRGYLYLSTRLLGVQVFDLRDPTNPRGVGLLKTAEYSGAAAPSGPLVFLLDGNGCHHDASLYVYPNGCEPSIGTVHQRPRAASSEPASALLPDQLRISVFPSFAKDRAVVRLALPGSGPAHVAVYDIAGRMVREILCTSLESGDHETVWNLRGNDGRPVAAGVYWIRVSTGESSRSRRLVILR